MLLWKKIRELTVDTRFTFPDGTSVDTKRIINAGSARTLTKEDAGRVCLLNTAAGSTVTLPRATGSGAVYTFVVSLLATSNSHIVKVGNATDGMVGSAVIADTDTANATLTFMAATAGTDDTITLNRSTTGSVTRGESIIVQDVAAGVFAVRAALSATGSPATPFSATVS